MLHLDLLRRPVAPAITWPILTGALIPDMALFIFYVRAAGGDRLPLEYLVLVASGVFGGVEGLVSRVENAFG